MSPSIMRDASARLAQRDRQVDGDRRLADAAFAGADRDDVLDARNRGLCAVGRNRRADLRGHLDGDARHAGKRADHRAGLIAHLILDRTRRRRQLDRKRDRAAVDAQVLDELERDDVAIEVGIAHGLERIEDGGFGDGHKAILSGWFRRTAQPSGALLGDIAERTAA